MFGPDILALVEEVLSKCRSRGWKVATAESCTGGLLAAALTAIAGSSDVIERGFVTYSNAAKMALLGVPEATLVAYGAVSSEGARAMAEGAVSRAPVDLAVSVTGLAGPGGGTSQKPTGLVCLGIARRGGGTARAERHVFPGDRTAIRDAALRRALELLLAEATAE